MPQEILRTEDIVEIKDRKVLLSTDISNLNLLAGSSLDAVATALEAHSPSLVQKQALTTLTSPGAQNPVVLLQDIPTYYPAMDLGGLKDSVENIVDLPNHGDVNELRPVLSVGMIYRWNGVSWVPFIQTGTLSHIQLSNQNGDNTYQHITADNLSSLITDNHVHQFNFDAVTSAGSGLIITSDERARIPTGDEKGALGTGADFYVTNLDPRMNTTRNPYTTIGPVGSGMWEGTDLTTLQHALNFIASSTIIKALEVLPTTYELTGDLVWQSTQFFRLECLTEAFFRWTSGGMQIVGQGPGAYLRGISFQGGGLTIEKPRVVIEDCKFDTDVTVGEPPCTFRRCTFSAALILNAETHVESCIFLQDLNINADNCTITGSQLTNTMIATVSNTILDSNRIAFPIVDTGNNTRILGKQLTYINQPYIGRTRTIGRIGSYADFCGNNETVFIRAFSDPHVSRIEVMGGNYLIKNNVIVPPGVTIYGTSSDVNLTFDAASLILASDDIKLENLQFNSNNASSVIIGAGSNIRILSCVFNRLLTTALPAIVASSAQDLLISQCSFYGKIRLSTCLRPQVSHCNFFSAFSSNLIAAEHFYIGDCFFGAGYPQLGGNNGIVRGNHFAGTLPPKNGTMNTLWIGNWPVFANNETGIDQLHVSMTEQLSPVNDAAFRGSILGSSAIGFQETGSAEAISLPIPLKVIVDEDSSYLVEFFWTSPIFSNNVAWEISVTFRDRIGQEIGTPIPQTVVSSRTNLRVLDEEYVLIYFPDYGLIPGVNPTHVSVKIRRLGDTVDDTLTGIAYLTKIDVIIPVK